MTDRWKDFQDNVRNLSLDKFSNSTNEEKLDTIKWMFDYNKLWNSEINTKEKLLRNIKKCGNKSLDNYERFKSQIFLAHESSRYGNSTSFFSSEDRERTEMIKLAINNNTINIKDKDVLYGILSSDEKFQMTQFFNETGKIFRVNSEILMLLRNTKCFIKYSKSPYSDMFICTDGLFFDNIEIFGIMVRDRIVSGVNDTSVDTCGGLSIIAFGRDSSDGESVWVIDAILESDDGMKRYNNKTLNRLRDKRDIDDETDNLIRTEAKRIVINFLNLINHPEVELVNHSMKLLRDARVKKGRLGIPDSVEINLTGKLKRYINETMKQNEKAWELGHRFWVRGHWMEFKHARYKNKQGQKTWVLPFIKGRGELIKKDYYVGEKEQCWEHEKQMIKIVTELYPEHEIKKHDRTTLDGLEIDCYIPELKLGFEYNGRQHYEHIEFFHKTKEDFEKQKERDIEKMKRVKEKGIKVIVIRYDEAVTKEIIQEKIKW